MAPACGARRSRAICACPPRVGLVGWADGDQRHVGRARHRPTGGAGARTRRAGRAGSVPRPLPDDARAQVRGPHRRAARLPVGAALDDVAARPGAAPGPGRAPWWRRILEGHARPARGSTAPRRTPTSTSTAPSPTTSRRGRLAVLAPRGRPRPRGLRRPRPRRLVEVHGEDVEARDIVVHLVEEYARHLGHADLLRECIDGRTGQ